MPTAKQRQATQKYVDAQLAWSAHSSCKVCKGQVNLVVNCPMGKALAMTLEAASEGFRAMEMNKTRKEKTERGN